MSARPRAHLSPKTRAKWHAVERDGTTLAEHELLRALGLHHMRVIRKRLGNTFGIGSGDLGPRFSPVELQSHGCGRAPLQCKHARIVLAGPEDRCMSKALAWSALLHSFLFSRVWCRHGRQCSAQRRE